MAQASVMEAQGPIDFEAIPTLAAIPGYFAARNPEKTAIRFEGEEVSWRDLDSQSARVANALIAEGLAPGDHAGFLGKASAQYFALMFGAAKAGLILTPVQWRLAAAEIAWIVADADVKLMFVGADHADALPELRAALPGAKFVVTDGDADGVPGFYDWMAQAPDTDPGVPVDAQMAALQLYTSGTTGKPKGVMLSHANILSGRRASMDSPMDWNQWHEDDVNLVALPVGHIGGTGWAIVGFMNGATTIVHRQFDPGAVLETIASEGISKLFVVPTMLQFMQMHPRARELDYSRLRYILYGASPIALDLLRQAMEVFGCGFAQQYGMTETCGTVVYLPPEDHDPAGNERMRGAGIPMPGVEIRIVDPSGKVAGPRETGEVETRSVANMLGYWKRPEATAETMAGDGWLKTGDAGYLDEDGYLYIQDRFKDMICSGAENIYPAEVESAIYGHPAVQEVAVIGVPDERWGEAVKAIVAPRPGVEADAEDIIAFARSRIAGFKVPKSVDFIGELPKGPTGKVLRRTLREPYWQGHDRRVG